MQVVATDNGSPMLTGSAQVTVTVNDVNDNTPVITNPPGNDHCQLASFILNVPLRRGGG